MDNFEQAIQEATKAIDVDGKTSDAYAIRADSLAGLEKFQEGYDDYKKALSLNPLMVFSAKSRTCQ